jgi:protein-disulfide isomerase
MAPSLRPPVSPRDHVRGGRDAAVELVEFGDYECPHCLVAHVVLKRIEYLMGSRLRFVFRNYPIEGVHPNALAAAIMAEAAGMQGRFWEMHDRLYENDDMLTTDVLARYASELGLDFARLRADTPAAEARVREDFASAEASGAVGTPTFYVNGVRYEGNWRDEAGFLATLEQAARSAPVMA